MNDCHNCIFKKNVPGDEHIACAHPDPDMTGNKQAIKNG